MIKIIYKQNSGAHRASAGQIYIQFLASYVRHVVVFVVVVNHIIKTTGKLKGYLVYMLKHFLI